MPDIIRALVLLATTVLWTTSAAAQVGRPGSPIANREHPRIWLSAQTLPGIRAKLAVEPMRSRYQTWVTFMGTLYPGVTTLNDKTSFNILNFAFIHHVGAVPGITYPYSPQQFGEQAKAAMMVYVREQLPKSVPDVSTRFPTAYDWLFHLLTEAERRETLSLLLNKEAVWDPAGGSALDDGESTTRLTWILVGLACANDGYEDAECAARATTYTDIQAPNAGHTAVLDIHNVIGADGGWAQGLSYNVHAPEGPLAYLFYLVEAWRTSNGLTKAEVYGGANAAVIRYFPQWWLHNIRPFATDPDDPTTYVIFKSHKMLNPNKPLIGGSRVVLGMCRFLKDIDPVQASLAQWLLEKRTGVIPLTGTNAQIWAMPGEFLFGESVPARSPGELGLPVSKLFSGLGYVSMRTGFESTADTAVTFMGVKWMRTEGSLTDFMSNRFTIDRNGPLAILSGSSTHHDYSQSTWAANTIIFPDSTIPEHTSTNPEDFVGSTQEFPASVGGAAYDRGGQVVSGYSRFGKSTQAVVTDPHYMKGVTRFEPTGPGKDYDYLSSDATRMYSGPHKSSNGNEPKVVNFTRQLIYFRPATRSGSDLIVIFDRAETTQTKFEKRWLLHPAATGPLESSGLVVNGTRTTNEPGRWTYTGADLITYTNTQNGSHGRLFSRTLLPRSVRMVLRGGPGADGKSHTASGYAFVDPYGNQYADPYGGDRQYKGEYRFEIIPAVPATRDVFLHVLEAATTSVTTPTASAALEGDTVVGARAGDRIAIFAKLEMNVGRGQVTIDRAGTYKILVCDLKPGMEYRLAGGTTQVASPAGTIYVPFTAAAGAAFSFEETGGRAAAPASPPVVVVR